MNKLTRISATVASSVALVAGFSGMASAASIRDTGHDSFNKIKVEHRVRTHVRNHTSVDLTNRNFQNAESGDVNLNDNDDVGRVTTGDTSNSNSTSVDLSVDNSSATDSALSGGAGGDSMDAPAARISDTGHDSTNVIKFDNSVSTKVSNNTDVSVDNSNCQTAESGDVTANDNDDVRNVSTGDATNTNTSTFTLNVTN